MPESSRPPKIVLASSSPYRAELFGRLRLDFEIRSPEVDESPFDGESGRALARRLAAAKAAAVAAECPHAVVIGSDQVAECRGRLLGKPGHRAAAIEQLSFCSGSQIVFHTAVTIRCNEQEHSALVPTSVLVRSLDRVQLERYVEIDHPFDCAGAMKSEALGISLTERMASDDPTALIGLPLISVVRLLGKFGIHVP